jgi:uncharacterized small protein (DUF1192 family)
VVDPRVQFNEVRVGLEALGPLPPLGVKNKTRYDDLKELHDLLKGTCDQPLALHGQTTHGQFWVLPKDKVAAGKKLNAELVRLGAQLKKAQRMHAGLEALGFIKLAEGGSLRLKQLRAYRATFEVSGYEGVYNPAKGTGGLELPKALGRKEHCTWFIPSDRKTAVGQLAAEIGRMELELAKKPGRGWQLAGCAAIVGLMAAFGVASWTVPELRSWIETALATISK